MNRTIAVADIGGTHARFACAEFAGRGILRLGEPVTLNTADHSGLESAWREFGRVAGIDLPDALAIAVAGPVGGDLLKLTNSGWVIRPALLDEQLGVRQYSIINDFGAAGHAVAQFAPSDFNHLCGPKGDLPHLGVTTIIGPGTGLGVAQLLKDASGYQVIETEGGHVDFAPLDEMDDKILAYLRNQFQRVSTERIASGTGLANLYEAIASIEGREIRRLEDRTIWTAALDGSDPSAAAALDRFFMSLGSVAADLVLAHGSNAVVIAGGLGYRLKDRFSTSGFADRFVAKGRFRARMESIPVKLVNHPQPGLYGAAAAFAKEFA